MGYRSVESEFCISVRVVTCTGNLSFASTNHHATMASLADELMNDLEELGSGSDVDDDLDAAVAGPSGSGSGKPGSSGAANGEPTQPANGSGAGADDGEGGGEEVDAAMAALADGEAHVPEGGIKPAQELDEEAVNAMDMTGVAEVSKVAKLQGSRTMREVLKVSSEAYMRQVESLD